MKLKKPNLNVFRGTLALIEHSKERGKGGGVHKQFALKKLRKKEKKKERKKKKRKKERSSEVNWPDSVLLCHLVI